MQRSLLFMGILLLAMGGTTSAQQPTIKDVNDAIKALKSNNPQDRAAGLAAMAYLGEGKSASKEVVDLMFDNSPLVRQWAGTALGKINPELAEPVLALVNSKDNDTRMDALQKLVGMGADLAGPALPALDRFLNQAEAQDRAKVVTALAQIGSKDAATAALLARVGLKDQDPAVRKIALAALPKMADVKTALTMFDGLMKNSDPAERALGVTGLTALAPTNADALKALKAAASDPSPTVSGAAKQAMEKVKKQQQEKK
jgi:HEAT repeat protein